MPLHILIDICPDEMEKMAKVAHGLGMFFFRISQFMLNDKILIK